MVPHTMANETAQKATWNRNLAESGTCVHESPAYTSLTCPAGTARNQPSVPTSALPEPKASANPTAQNNRAAMARLTRIFATTLPTFFIREKPTSNIANPACMKRTRHAVMITQTVSIASERSAVEGPFCANASPGNASISSRTVVDNNASLRKSFLLASRGMYSRNIVYAPVAEWSLAECIKMGGYPGHAVARLVQEGFRFQASAVR